jgi:sugar phosphate isomerase/epimerase
MPESRCQRLRKYAAGKAIEILAVAANNDFSSPISDRLESQLLCTRELIRITADLGAKIIRVFLAWPGVTNVAGQGGRYDNARKGFAAPISRTRPHSR